MVHALQRAGGRLRRGGFIVGIRPHQTWRPSISIVTSKSQIPVTELDFSTFGSNLSSSDAALARVVANRFCTAVGTAEARWRTYLDRLPQMRTYLEMIRPPRPRFPRGTRAKLAELWDRAPRGARIQVNEPLVINVLRRR